MKVYSLGSGSSGNSFLVSEAGSAILVDCGIGARRTRAFLREQGVDGRLSGVLISHEHGDHVRALPSVRRYQRCGIFSTEGTFRAIGVESDCNTIQPGRQFSIGSVGVTPVSVSHDGESPVGFVIEGRSSRVAIFTDLGIPSGDVRDALSDSDTVVLESNYCPSMLQVSPYPARVKQRIRGPLGHLSNDDCATLLASAISEKTTGVWLAHLSENNNSPDLARAVAAESLSIQGIDVDPTPLPRFEPALLMDDGL